MVKVNRIGFIAEITGNAVNGDKINFSWLGPSKESSHQVLGDMQSDKLMRGWDKDRCVQGFVDAYDSYLEVEIYPVSVQNTVKESFQNPDTAFKITESIVGKMRTMEMIGKREVSLIKFRGAVVFQTKQNRIERFRGEREPGVYEITTGFREQSSRGFSKEPVKEREVALSTGESRMERFLDKLKKDLARTREEIRKEDAERARLIARRLEEGMEKRRKEMGKEELEEQKEFLKRLKKKLEESRARA